MLLSAKSLIGLPVRVRGTSRHCGYVKDVCIDATLGRLCAVVVSTSGLIKTSYLVYWQEIMDVDHNVLWIESADALREVAELPDQWWSTHRSPGVWRRGVRDEAGRTVGVLGDLLIDRTGRIEACRVSDGVVMDFLQGGQNLFTPVNVSDDLESLTVTVSMAPPNPDLA